MFSFLRYLRCLFSLRLPFAVKATLIFFFQCAVSHLNLSRLFRARRERWKNFLAFFPSVHFRRHKLTQLNKNVLLRSAAPIMRILSYTLHELETYRHSSSGAKIDNCLNWSWLFDRIVNARDLNVTDCVECHV